MLYIDDIPLRDVAESTGTPCYVYGWQDIESRYTELKDALSGVDAHIRYAVKANSNLSILRRLAGLGSGFDIVSGGELERVLLAGGDPQTVVFSGVGKSIQEISFAIKCGIGCFNVESAAEAERIAEQSRLLGRTVNVAIRVNPDINVETHPYITTGLRENKFGLPETQAHQLASRIHRDVPTLRFLGLACHIGSQLHDLNPYSEALDAMLRCQRQLQEVDIPCSVIDMGGGFGISYDTEKRLSFMELGAVVRNKVQAGTRLEVEPGRSIVGEAGVLLTRVEYLKPAIEDGYRDFCIVDAAMNDLLRPSLYQAFHEIEPVETGLGEKRAWDVVGPVCETGDFLGNRRTFAAHEGQLLAIRDTGAYGFTMSSNYNSRPRVPEVIVDGDSWTVARKRESMSDLVGLEVS